MPKSVEELFDGADQSPQDEAAGLLQEAAPAELAPREAEPPVPNAQDGKGDQPDAAAGREEGAPPAPEDNDGRDSAYGRLRKEGKQLREERDQERIAKARLEEQNKALEARLKALEQAQKPSQPQEQPRAIDPNADPVAYAVQVARQEAQQAALIQHLNITEDALREKEGDEAVDAAVETFKQMREANPALQQQFLNQRNPYKWMFAEVKKRKAQAEIGDDPDAYRAKIEADTKAKLEAEIRAQIAAESQGQPEQRQPNPSLPPSLGRVPNAGARSVTHTGPVPIETLWG